MGNQLKRTTETGKELWKIACFDRLYVDHLHIVFHTNKIHFLGLFVIYLCDCIFDKYRNPLNILRSCELFYIQLNSSLLAVATQHRNSTTWPVLHNAPQNMIESALQNRFVPSAAIVFFNLFLLVHCMNTGINCSIAETLRHLKRTLNMWSD